MKKNVFKKIMAYLGTPLLYCIAVLTVTAVIFFSFFSDIKNVIDLAITNSQALQPEAKDKDIENLSDITGGVINSSDMSFPNFGDHLGKLEIKNAQDTYLTTNIYFGDETEQLSKGVGVFYGSSLPGFGSTVLVSGHNHTKFRPLQKTVLGDIVTITTYYGVYTYRVKEIKPYQYNRYSDFIDLLADYENLVMYTCYPFGSIGFTPQRYFIICEYVSGPQVDIWR